MKTGGGFLPEEKGRAPDQNTAFGVPDEAAYETGHILLPEVAPNFRREVASLLEPSRAKGEAKKHVGPPWPTTDKGPVSEFRASGFVSLAPPLVFPMRRRVFLRRKAGR